MTGALPDGPPRRAVLALGSNLGDRLAALQHAVDALGSTRDVTVAAVSPVYETEPVGGPPQPDFLNAVVLVDTYLSPPELLERAQAIEGMLHRTREVRWGPRTLDVDIVSYQGATSDDPRLTLPHPRAHERVFVLAPWLDLDGGAEVPGVGRVRELLAALDQAGARRRRELTLWAPQ
jgi:2-amino-4-hydroxy-6-hydroxymethyldihydropteridine diphosphokinase